MVCGLGAHLQEHICEKATALDQAHGSQTDFSADENVFEVCHSIQKDRSGWRKINYSNLDVLLKSSVRFYKNCK